MGLRPAFVFCAAAIGCAAQSLVPNIYRVGGDVSAPVLLYRTNPEYSDEARVAKLQGSVMVSLVIGEDGNGSNFRVTRPLGLGLDENAVAAVSHWKFTPGKKNGVPVPVECDIEVSFHLLLQPEEWYPSRVAFTTPQGATEPRFLSSPPHAPSGIADPARMRLSFDIDSEGHPINVHIDDSSDPGANDAVMAMIMEWRFRAALRQGIPVESHGVIDLSRGLDEERPKIVQPPFPRKLQ